MRPQKVSGLCCLSNRGTDYLREVAARWNRKSGMFPVPGSPIWHDSASEHTNVTTIMAPTDHERARHPNSHPSPDCSTALPAIHRKRPGVPRIHPTSLAYVLYFHNTRHMDMTHQTDANPICILFVCTGNSARSILCEALLRTSSGGRFRAYSAGSRPVGRVHPLALSVLQDERIPTDGLESKSWDRFAEPGSPRLDIVVTVCDSAAGESCPLFLGDVLRVHWSLSDPASAGEDEKTRHEAFRRTFDAVNRRVHAMTALPLESMPRSLWRERLQAIAHIQTEKPA